MTLAPWREGSFEIATQAPGRELGLQVMAIWNELIALDMAKTLNDRYLSSACEAHKEPKRFRSRKRV